MRPLPRPAHDVLKRARIFQYPSASAEVAGYAFHLLLAAGVNMPLGGHRATPDGWSTEDNSRLAASLLLMEDSSKTLRYERIAA
jgi:hypothetical protein